MRTERYNIYDKIHDDLRKRVLHAGLKIQSTDFSNPAYAGQSFEAIKNVIGSFDRYMEKDTQVFHAIAAVAPYIVLVVEQVNEKNKQLTLTLNQKMEHYLLTRTRAMRIKLGAEIQHIFFEFMAAVLQNINKEEAIINELLWSTYTNAELAALEASIISVSMKEPIQEQTERIGEEYNNKRSAFLRESFKNPAPSFPGKLVEMINDLVHPERRTLSKNRLSAPP